MHHLGRTKISATFSRAIFQRDPQFGAVQPGEGARTPCVGGAVLPLGGSCRAGRGWDSASHHITPCCARCSVVHKQQHPIPSTPWPTPHSQLPCSVLWLCTGAFSCQCRSAGPAPGHCSCSTSLPFPPFLQHKLQKSLAAARVPFLLSLCFGKPFCSVDLNYCPRLKSLGLVMRK